MGVQSGNEESLVKGPVLLFDGVCHFCNGTVQFIIPRDKEGKIRFASLQSDFGQARLTAAGLPLDEFDSLVFIENGKTLVGSTAAFSLTKYLSAPWSWLRFLLWIPRPLRDWGYSLIAKNRYKLFGKTDECMLPSPDVRRRFIEI